MSEAWLSMTAADLGRGIDSGEISPVDLTEAYLAAIAAHPFTTRIYARTTASRARAEAEASEARTFQGQRLSPLDGVPISWKDLFDTGGVATEAGTALLAGRTPDRDATVLTNATAAGLVCLGKTHMTELAFSGIGYNPVTASPPNIHDPESASGGSSSGAATSVAYGLAAAAIGSDTGGSVRVPSAWNDLVGLKTTAGRVSNTGVVPLCPRFDTVGPLCRSVEDAALLLAALEGGQAADLTGVRLDGLRLMILETAALDAARDEPKAGFDHAVGRLEDAGAQIVRREVPAVAKALEMSAVLFATEAYGTWRDVIEANPDVMFPGVRERFRGGRAFSGADYVSAWHRLDALRADWAMAVADCDAVLLPTVPNMPPRLDRLAKDNDYFMAENLLALSNTRIGNLMGLPGLTLPTGLAGTGISLLGTPFGEERLLRIGVAAEAALT
jgi:aspartyl-tRNA(Asn)/glutamyl-tRNA(Gln) amidotransferase subunit A